MKKVAILITCHNRKDKTLDCLDHLYTNIKDVNDFLAIDTYLTDDGSTDGTSNEVKKKFPEVKIIAGNGSLFWAGGMRMAWEYAAQKNDYNYYIWLNDDTIIHDHAVRELFDDYNEGCSIYKKDGIITAACCNSHGDFSYGGRNKGNVIKPNNTIQRCILINGNYVLIPQAVFSKIGNLDKHFTHGIADYSYGLTAIENGFECWTTKKYLATCEQNDCPRWCSPQTPLKERIKLLHSPKGINIEEYLYYIKKHKLGFVFWIRIKIHFRAFFPMLYSFFKEKTQNVPG